MRVICKTRPQASSGINLHVQDNFKLNYKFPDHSTNPPLLIPLDKFDLQIEYYIKGRPERFVALMKDGIGVSNCIADYSTGTLRVIFEKHGLQPGLLFAKYSFEFPDPDFCHGKGTSIVVESTGIMLNDDIY